MWYKPFLRLLGTLLTFAAPCGAADLTVALGTFRFPATDYYYPYFFGQAGVRGEIAYGAGERYVSTIKLILAGYPMDDNIFDVALEQDFRPRITRGVWDVVVEPALGVQITKFEYPKPYFNRTGYQLKPWLRFGADVGVGRSFGERVAVYAKYRGRALYAFYGWEQLGGPWKPVHGPYGEFVYRRTNAFAFLGRAGWEFGGYYDDVFMPPSYLLTSRPYFEAGFRYSF